MEFLEKYSKINANYGEIGCAIGQLSDSIAYNDTFLSITDRIEALNAGDKVETRLLCLDMQDLINQLRKEGCILTDHLTDQSQPKEGVELAYSFMEFGITSIIAFFFTRISNSSKSKMIRALQEEPKKPEYLKTSRERPLHTSQSMYNRRVYKKYA